MSAENSRVTTEEQTTRKSAVSGQEEKPSVEQAPPENTSPKEQPLKGGKVIYDAEYPERSKVSLTKLSPRKGGKEIPFDGDILLRKYNLHKHAPMSSGRRRPRR
jgi:hypothetical protein